MATPPTTKITHSPLNQNKMKLIYKITLLVLAVLAIIACLICIIVLISTMWKMFLAIIALVILALFAMWLSGKIYDELGIIPDIEHYEY